MIMRLNIFSLRFSEPFLAATAELNVLLLRYVLQTSEVSVIHIRISSDSAELIFRFILFYFILIAN